MPRSSFLWRLYAGYAVLIFVCATIVGVLIARQVERHTLDEIETSLRVRATLLRDAALPALQDSSTADLQERVRSLGEEIGTRLTVILSDGTVIADSEEEPFRMDDHSNRPEILAARAEGSGTAIRFSATLRTQMMYLALAAGDGGEPLGFVRASLPLSAIDRRIGELRSVVILGAACAAVVALLLGFFVARGLAAPLASMTSVAEAMSRGDYGQKLPVARTDEVGVLGEALNRMAQSSRERMETITRHRNELLAILSGMAEGVVAVDAEERVLHVNAAAGAILQARVEDAPGRRIWEVSRVADVSELLSATVQAGSALCRVLRLVGRPRDRVVQMHSAPLRSGEGEVVGAVAVLHDLTELDRLERVRSDFVSNVSHELKTPITAIRALVETLSDDQQMDAETRDRFLRKVSDQTQRLTTLVTDLLALSRLESGEAALEREVVDLCDVIEDVARDLMPLAEERGLAVEIEQPRGSLELRGDPEALRQVTANLLDNALKYTPAGGRVNVRLGVEERHAVLEVEDTGIGIERRHQDRIFERFYRVDRARSRELGGTGLGLAIVKHVAQAHHGEVSVESAPGRGSTFRVRLPLAGGAPGESAGARGRG